MPRHKAPETLAPPWIKSETNDCLVSVGEETYTARNLAVKVWNAEQYPQCRELLNAGDKSRRILDDTRADTSKRTDAGERALRKYWEAKSCARRLQSGK